MKVMKLALLGTAALAAVSVSARADDLTDLKAQIEALQADVAALQAAPSVPAGYSLLTMSEAPAIVVPGLEIRDSNAKSATVNTIGVLPTADVPASTVIQWSGSVRAAIAYTDVDYSYASYTDYNELHLKARGRLDVTGTTDTAVGEVGASMSFYGDFDNNMTGGTGFTTNSASVYMDYAWGWWKMTPELTFAGGYNGSLATIGYGIRKINDAYISRGGLDVNGGDFTQLRLSYNSGPIGVAVALEHTDENGNFDGAPGDAGGPFGVAAEVTYSGDVFNAEIAGFLRDADTNYAAALVARSRSRRSASASVPSCRTCSTSRLPAASATTSGTRTRRAGLKPATAGKSAPLLWPRCLTRSRPNWALAGRAMTPTLRTTTRPTRLVLPAVCTGRPCLS
ncbi:MAG: hypothetical protein IPM06_14420 [Rhizobiales bacterium]|nr:hypothetical protein [Hyphomicrobiales bacterium]